MMKPTKVEDIAKKKESTSPTNMITKDYANILVNQLLNTTESITTLNHNSSLSNVNISLYSQNHTQDYSMLYAGL